MWASKFGLDFELRIEIGCAGELYKRQTSSSGNQSQFVQHLYVTFHISLCTFICIVDIYIF